MEMIYSPTRGFTVFEISARIVAGISLYPMGSCHSAYPYEELMSTVRRIAGELKHGLQRAELDRIIF